MILRSPRAALALLAFGSLSCRRAPPPRTADWRPVVPGHTVRAGTPADLRWTLRDGCPLAYEWHIRSRVLPNAQARAHGAVEIGMEASGRVEGDARGGVASLRVLWRELRHVQGGARSAPQREEGVAAPVLLRVDGRDLREVDGPTTMWAAYGTFGGLVRFFPTLPAGPAAGATTAWRFQVFPTNVGAATDVRRGGLRLPPGAGLPGAPPTEYSGTARVAQWLSLDGEDVAVVETEAAREHREPVPGVAGVELRSTWRTRGEHLVSARGGRLLLARYDDETELRSRGAPAAGLDQDHRTHGEIRLVAACDGVTLRSPLPAPSPQDRAVAAVTALRNAVAQGDRAATLAGLAPALRTRHGDDALWQTLSGFVRRHGAVSLGFTEVLAPDAVAAVGPTAWRVALLGRCEACPTRRLTNSLEVRVDLTPEGARVQEIRSSSVQGPGAPADLLFVGEGALRGELADAGAP